MRSPRRDILVVIKNPVSEQVLEKELTQLNALLVGIESAAMFCQAHELVDRFRITSRSKRILRESSFRELRPFRFLINKN